MTQESNKPRRTGCDALDALLDPARAFAHPMDVVGDRDLTLYEKRAILAAWASDACAVEAAPALRRPPGGPAIRFDDIMDALRVLDRESGGFRPPPRYRRVLARRRPPDETTGSQPLS
ncbi:MAG: hypothetical protein M5U07_14450 [Xanthobacteraceae bacterium]|nr:hypothetical protein [Xanthobacteraceae bacterium]GIK80807.1 MAG: hypothetical protein BroJett024_19120 [Alphaproteobacteria bacterium]